MNRRQDQPNPILRGLVVAVIVLAAALAVLLALSGCSSSGPVFKAAESPAPTTPTTVKAAGQITLTSTSIAYPTSGGCQGKGGYSDIHEGTQVVISDATGKTVALGQLEQGVSIGTGKCAFAFEVDTVPAGEDFYQVEISHRGKLQFTPQQIGSLDLTLGS